MKLKIAIGRLNQVEQFTPIKQKDYTTETPAACMQAFKSFFDENEDLDLPADVNYILQAGENWTVSTILSIKYYLQQANMNLEFYAFEESDIDILDDLTRIHGVLLLDDSQKYFGFIPRGFFLRLTNEEDANPINIYTWVGSQVKMFPGMASDPFSSLLEQTKEFHALMGSVSTPIVAKFMGILTAFNKRVVII